MRLTRFVKYGYGAPLIGFVIRTTRLLDGDGAPPPFINFAGGGDFQTVGAELVESLVTRAGLTSSHRVLDLGSGIGRVAVALENRFPAIDYLGLEIVRYGVDWCRKRFGKAPNFRFQYADIYNSFYNPRGRVSAQEFQFPLASRSRDFILATSVFTHLQEATTRHYLQEFGRCLEDGGTVYLTTFLTDRCAENAAFRFRNRIGRACVERLDEPDMAVAYSLDFWTEAATSAGLTVSSVFQGTWSTRDLGLSQIGPEFQDIILLRREEKGAK